MPILPPSPPAAVAAPFTVSPPVELRVGRQLPVGLDVMPSMNNVDVVPHAGRYYLAFRTGPTHFASDQVLLQVLSSSDGESWQSEQTITLGADVREPRFLSFNGHLFLYFFKGGTDPFEFDPDHMYVTEKTATGWTTPEIFGEPGFVPWRAKVHDGKAYLSAYYGKGLYTSQTGSAVHLYTSDDGRHWLPISAAPQVTTRGAEEPEYEWDRDGNLWGTIRLENEGAEIVYAPKGDLAHWQTIKTPYKYDSALLFRHGDDLYLIARRSLDGVMDHAPKWFPTVARQYYNLGRYSATRKRTAIYRFDTRTRTITPLVDLPTQGDTAYPALAPINDHQYLLLNYSNRIGEGHDYPWIVGQLNPTRLYTQVITFPAAEPAAR